MTFWLWSHHRIHYSKLTLMLMYCCGFNPWYGNLFIFFHEMDHTITHSRIAISSKIMYIKGIVHCQVQEDNYQLPHHSKGALSYFAVLKEYTIISVLTSSHMLCGMCDQWSKRCMNISNFIPKEHIFIFMEGSWFYFTCYLLVVYLWLYPESLEKKKVGI